MASLVMVVSGATVWTMKNAKPHPTGFWAEEFVTPHRKFTEAGFKVTVASPGGVAPTVDPLSFNLVLAFFEDLTTSRIVKYYCLGAYRHAKASEGGDRKVPRCG